MDTFLQNGKEEKGINKVFLAAIGAAILIVAVIAGAYVSMPTPKDLKQQHLEGAFLEGSPEFEVLTKKISIKNDYDNTLESFTGLGTITMSTSSRIRNVSDKTIVALEIRVSVLSQFDKVVREKKQIVVPSGDVTTLPPNSDIYVNVPIEGFSKDDDRARVQWKVTAIKIQ